MKWVVVGVLVCLVRFGEGGASRCLPGVQDLSCTTGLDLEEPHQLAREESGSERTAEAECLAGSEWDSNCHRCSCSSAGVAVCVQQADCKQQVSADPIRCKPFTKFARDCNTCTCLENGDGLCTLVDCGRSAIPKKSELPEGRECVPGTHWRSQCNDCGCSPDGSSFCTEKACVGQASETLMRCLPDSLWRNKCNTCWCTSDGLPICTKIGCVDSIEIADTEGNSGNAKSSEANSSVSRMTRAVAQEKEVPKTCLPGQEFRMDCNKCLCDNEGQDFSCTRNDCNAVNNNNGGARSRRDTSVHMPTKCSPGKVFDKDCNVCRCTTDGHHATCTMKRCSSEQSNSLTRETDSHFRCNPGEKFKRDCNDCSCSADGTSAFCTKFKCDQDNSSPRKL